MVRYRKGFPPNVLLAPPPESFMKQAAFTPSLVRPSVTSDSHSSSGCLMFLLRMLMLQLRIRYPTHVMLKTARIAETLSRFFKMLLFCCHHSQTNRAWVARVRKFLKQAWLQDCHSSTPLWPRTVTECFDSLGGQAERRVRAHRNVNLPGTIIYQELACSNKQTT